MPLLGLGTWRLGGGFERDESVRFRDLKTLETALEIGYRLIDTAEIYGNGLAEELIGEAFKKYKREEFFIVSKVWKSNLSATAVRHAVEGSLKRLQTDYLDLYLVHWPSEEVAMEETFRAMEELATNGLVRSIGVSNFNVEQIKEAERCLKNITLRACQIEFNLTNQGANKDVIPYCNSRGIEIMAYRPLGKGTLAKEHSLVVNELALKYKKTPAQIALNWLVSQKISAIPKASSQEHLLENFGALGWQMNQDDIKKLCV